MSPHRPMTSFVFMDFSRRTRSFSSFPLPHVFPFVAFAPFCGLPPYIPPNPVPLKQSPGRTASRFVGQSLQQMCQILQTPFAVYELVFPKLDAPGTKRGSMMAARSSSNTNAFRISKLGLL